MEISESRVYIYLPENSSWIAAMPASQLAPVAAGARRRSLELGSTINSLRSSALAKLNMLWVSMGLPT
jgi:hypothetical protein